jgi:hypothetical protein
MRTWTHDDHDRFGDDPRWADEPDKAVWVDPATDLDCMLHRNRMGAWCGYVGVGPDHPLHGQDYEHVHVEVHGGLTYADECQTGDDVTEADGICHVPEPGRSHDIWWFGFDTAHMGDLIPYDLDARRAMGDASPLLANRDEWSTYKNFDYVKREVEHLASQLRDLARTSPEG